ncbi:MAG: sigma 54-dependent Fis family transcriptional regulator [Deltaproteobacteria bacterium]|nr:sigma 54-dependent Fis family transcriptional regulator [Deltaproteobacteria bacterium]
MSEKESDDEGGIGGTLALHGTRQETVTPPAVDVRVVAGPDAGRRAQVALERLTIGTHPSCNLILTDPTVSRFHCDVRFAAEGVLLSDLGSTNGTRVGNLRVKAAFVEPGAQVHVGKSTIEIAAPRRKTEVSISPESRLGNLVGQSVAMRRLFVAIARVAEHPIPVLIQGETGTGKEVVAREIHAQSGRNAGPLVVVDCGAIPAELAESELFGHTRGAFSGATAERRGAFESADGGTLFLDEIGELDLDLQPRLLRAVEAKEVKRVGSDTYRSVDVRVVAATNRDLRVAVNQGTFREDLYFRLAVATIHVPPLRERAEDIPLLVDHFFAEAARAYDLPAKQVALDNAEVARLVAMPWNGNCRELRNYVDQRLVFGGGGGESEFLRADAALASGTGAGAGVASGSSADGGRTVSVRTDLDYKAARATCLDDFERAYISARLREAGGNASRAAREIGIDRVYLMRLIKRHGIKAE